MIEYIKGDLFTTGCKYIAHGCNCQGVMGAGVAKIVRDKYPACYEAYHQFVKENINKNLLGLIHLWYSDDRAIFNCFTQNIYANVSYDGVHDSFLRMATYMRCHTVEEVAMPRIGAGIGGGDWNIIEAIIESTLCKVGATVKVYEL